MMALASRRNQYLDGGYGMDCAQDTAAALDEAVREILDHCYSQAVSILEESREDVDKVVAYLLEKETITGGEMVAIIEGRDPALVEGAYTSTRAKPQLPEDVEPPARHIHIVDEPIPMPPHEEDGERPPEGEDPEKPDKPKEE